MAVIQREGLDRFTTRITARAQRHRADPRLGPELPGLGFQHAGIGEGGL